MKTVLGALAFILLGWAGLWIAGNVIEFLVSLPLGLTCLIIVGCFAVFAVVFSRLAVSK